MPNLETLPLIQAAMMNIQLPPLSLYLVCERFSLLLKFGSQVFRKGYLIVFFFVFFVLIFDHKFLQKYVSPIFLNIIGRRCLRDSCCVSSRKPANFSINSVYKTCTEGSTKQREVGKTTVSNFQTEILKTVCMKHAQTWQGPLKHSILAPA